MHWHKPVERSLQGRLPSFLKYPQQRRSLMGQSPMHKQLCWLYPRLKTCILKDCTWLREVPAAGIGGLWVLALVAWGSAFWAALAGAGCDIKCLCDEGLDALLWSSRRPSRFPACSQSLLLDRSQIRRCCGTLEWFCQCSGSSCKSSVVSC